MPSKTPKQARTMQAAAHSPSFATSMGIPQAIAKEFAAADKRGSMGKQVRLARVIRQRR